MEVRSHFRRVGGSRLVPVLMLSAAIPMMSAVAPAHASGAVTPAARQAKLSPATLARFRSQMEAFYKKTAQIGRSASSLHNHAQYVRFAVEGEQALSAMNAKQLSRLYRAMSVIPHWQQVPSNLAAVAADAPYRSQNGLKPRDIAPGSTCVEGGVTYPEPGLSVVLGLQDAAAAAQAASDASPDSLVEGAVVAGEGAVSTFPDPVRVALAATEGTTAAAALAADNAHQLYEECSTDALANLVQSISDNLATDASNIRSDIAALKSDVDTRLTAVASQLTDIVNKVTGVQTTLDTNMEQRQIHLQVVSPPGNKTLLVSTTEGGQPVTTSLVSIKAATPANPSTFTNVTNAVTTSAPTSGVLAITLPSPYSGNTVFQIEVSESSTIDGQSVTHYGTILTTL